MRPADGADPGGLLDGADEAVLAELRRLYERVDPPPGDLTTRVRFALDLEDLDAEVSRLREDLVVGAGARGAERTRTITFDGDSLTIMVTLTELPGGDVRLDGWLAPAAPRRVELRRLDGPVVVRADADGRFVLPAVGPGLSQLVVHALDGAGGPSVVTPSFTV